MKSSTSGFQFLIQKSKLNHYPAFETGKSKEPDLTEEIESVKVNGIHFLLEQSPAFLPDTELTPDNDS